MIQKVLQEETGGKVIYILVLISRLASTVLVVSHKFFIHFLSCNFYPQEVCITKIAIAKKYAPQGIRVSYSLCQMVL